MRTLILCCSIILCLSSFCKGQTYHLEIQEFQKELNHEFRSAEDSPLSEKELNNFKGHDFYSINESFKVETRFIKTENPISFQMKTTTDRLPTYEKYAEVVFELRGKEHKLSVYQSHTLREKGEYREYLFLPFTDLTNGEDTYAGGRFIDLIIPEGDKLIVDFNKAYNPYCAYSEKYSCPIPPAENNLEIRIEAGIRMLTK